MQQRIVARLLARELTEEEIGEVSGGYPTYSSGGTVSSDTHSTILVTFEGIIYGMQGVDDSVTQEVIVQDDFVA